GGCLLLVVEILKTEETKIFFKPLLPIELKRLINTKGEQRSYNVELKSLDTSNFYSICRRMVEQMRKQPPILIEVAQIDEGDDDKIIYESITYEYNPHDFLDIFNHDFYEYGIKENVIFPIVMRRINSFSTEEQKIIQVGEREYKVDTKIEIK